jgi:hypothetical protein
LKQLSDKENYSSQIEELSRNLELKKTQISQLSQMNNSLIERTQEFSLSNHISDSRTAYALSLYSKISNITWNYDASNSSEGRFVGYISNDQKKELREFDLDLVEHMSSGKAGEMLTKELAEFELTNKMWDMIAASHNM